MWIFKRTPPPPPKIPQWLTISVPIIITILLGLVALVYNTMAADVKEVKEQVEKVEEKKVDNETLKILLENQKLMIQQQKEEAERQRVEDAKKFDQLQHTQSKTLERIEDMQKEKVFNREIKAPRGFSIKSKDTKVALTPEQFEKYLSMDPKVRVKYKQYLERSGKDISELPD